MLDSDAISVDEVLFSLRGTSSPLLPVTSDGLQANQEMVATTPMTNIPYMRILLIFT